MLAYITSSVNEDLLRRIEYLLEPSSILPFVDDEERKRSLWFRGEGGRWIGQWNPGNPIQEGSQFFIW